MTQKILLVGCLGVLFGVVDVFGQQPGNPLPDFVYKNAQKRAEMERVQRQAENVTDRQLPDPRRVAEAARREEIRKEELERIKVLLAPDPADVARYREFLKQPDTGLFRLLPDFGCVATLLVEAGGDCASFVPDSWVYSFRQRDYAAPAFFSDIRLSGENLISGGFLAQGIFVPLGDVSLEKLSAENAGIKYLAGFKPADNLPGARRQFTQISDGFDSGGYRYSNIVRYEENTTYALRVAAYKSNRKPKIERRDGAVFSRDDARYSILNNDRRIDLIIAFRIIRKEENGGITVLWKEISRRAAPKLIISKNENLTDLK